MLFYTLLFYLFATVLIGHGLAAGIVLAPLHRAAMGKIDEDRLGMAAGVYSMIRFGGSAIGVALSGVIVQSSLDLGLSTVAAYQFVFVAIAAVVGTGVLLGLKLQE